MTDQSTRAVASSGERAGEAQLEAVLRRLGVACGEGRLTLEEFSARAQDAYVARTAAALLRTLDGLPGRIPGASLVTRDPQEGTAWHVALIGGVRRSGRWIMEHRLISLTLIGSVNLDLRKALLSGPEASVMALAVVGGVNACVPSGVRVDVGGLSLFGQRSVDVEAPAPGAPVIRIQAYAVAGGVRVTSPRGWH
jgi:hypothetical protein